MKYPPGTILCDLNDNAKMIILDFNLELKFYNVLDLWQNPIELPMPLNSSYINYYTLYTDIFCEI